MPIAHDDLNNHDDVLEPHDMESTILGRPRPPLSRLSEESLRTEFCEGPIPDSPQMMPSRKSDEDMTSSREELIEKLKKGESLTWVPSRHLETLLRRQSPEAHCPRNTQALADSPELQPAMEITPDKIKSQAAPDARVRDGMSLERPGSALHSGDFTDDDGNDANRRSHPRRPQLDTWAATSPPRDFTSYLRHGRGQGVSRSRRRDSIPVGTSPHSISSSLSSSLAFQPPTSPLVCSETNEDLEIAEALDHMEIPSPTPNMRRHTFYAAQSSPYASPSARMSSHSNMPTHRRQGSFPTQAHQPRRSLSFLNGGEATLSPPTPNMMRAARRSSLGTDASPLSRHAAMVGSYEESILRGRMSTTPSKPLDFMAQIAVLGMGKCKSSLRCPAHVTLPFHAVYYSYNTTSHGRPTSDDSPSPYVGQIDLENGLPNQDDSRSRRKAQSRCSGRNSMDMAIASSACEEEMESHRPQKSRRTSAAPRAPPGGSYRIPEKGQLQIIIKNQNKTAVKLFLVPYDLAGMEPGTKTFVRQRCFSAGPIIDGVPPIGSGPPDKQTLRYLIHLHICSPSRGRFYLYKSIRVVFANRVPDGKERLRSETTWPEPRFTPYKAIRVMHPPMSTGAGAGAALAADKAFRRRSSGISFPSIPRDLSDGVSPSTPYPFASALASGHATTVEPIPFTSPVPERPNSEASNAANDPMEGIRLPESRDVTRPSSGASSAGPVWEAGQYAKLSKGDQGYGINGFASGSPGSEGLLSQRLRSLRPSSPSDEG
ncbi:uncharacterized protein F5Z01DRAFT_30137 [Emericellopsis atlantica]|uniref:Atos-like conserved domain-containing protein n=1 Tax=Emericellopsis atlantica TaxID=2614577 RepID=A0A9P7ZVQ0_9HYPO|nr:uncharacterized protein F5Z01DRAFT_30137 [Emericellopsis atlantica]KAG9259209.1 hypothetical protein F5Z01DRAFT_30137 [Emericellopsis atlantica]